MITEIEEKLLKEISGMTDKQLETFADKLDYTQGRYLDGLLERAKAARELERKFKEAGFVLGEGLHESLIPQKKIIDMSRAK